MTLYIYKKAQASADNASRSGGEIKSEQYTTPNTPASNATIGGLIGAAIGGLGGYTWGASDLDHLSEEQKFKRRLKNALLYGAVGAAGGAGLGYGGTVLANQLDKKREKNTVEEIGEWYAKAPFGTGSFYGGIGLGAHGAFKGIIAAPHELKGTTRKWSAIRGGIKGALNGVLLGGLADIIRGGLQAVVNK